VASCKEVLRGRKRVSMHGGKEIFTLGSTGERTTRASDGSRGVKAQTSVYPHNGGGDSDTKKGQ